MHGLVQVVLYGAWFLEVAQHQHVLFNVEINNYFVVFKCKYFSGLDSFVRSRDQTNWLDTETYYKARSPS